MSLWYDITKIENHEQVCYVTGANGPEISPVTHAIIMGMMFIGPEGGVLTEKNIGQVVTRLAIWQSVNGPLLSEAISGKTYERYVTADELRQHVGLKTNAWVSTKDFKRSIWSALERDAIKSLELAAKEQTKRRWQPIENLAHLESSEVG